MVLNFMYYFYIFDENKVCTELRKPPTIKACHTRRKKKAITKQRIGQKKKKKG